MKRFCFAVLVTTAIAGPSHAQSPAFVPQLSQGGSATVQQQRSSSHTEIRQLPPDAKPRRQQTSPTPRKMVERQLLKAPNSQHALSTDENRIAVRKHSAGNTPDLPVLSQGVTVAITLDNARLPDVGNGAVSQ